VDDEPQSRVGVFQSLANGSPDVDAIYRLLGLSEDITFTRRSPITLAELTFAPLNSQNTWFQEGCFPLLYLPSTVEFRFTDILRGLVAQPILWRFGYRVSFTDATVRQKRNPHSPFEDFLDEIGMYKSGELPLVLAKEAALESETMTEALQKTYASLHKEDIVSEHELVCLESWLEELEDSVNQIHQ